MRAKRVDANHGQVVSALRKAGGLVLDLSRVGNGCADILVAYGERMWMLEIKDGSKVPSKQALNPLQVKFHKEWGHHIQVVTSPEEALRAVGL